MLRYFPENNITYAHRKRDYLIAAFTFICVAISLNIDASGSLEKQNLMGIIAWIFLIGLLIGENKDVRTQVETSNTSAVLDGEIDEFIETYLRQAAKVE